MISQTQKRHARDLRQSRTLTTDLFEQLRSDILHCRLSPGARLRFKELRARYGSGLSPLREALMRLVAGLIKGGAQDRRHRRPMEGAREFRSCHRQGRHRV